MPLPPEASDIFIAFDPGGTTGVASGYHTGSPDFVLMQSLAIPWDQRYDVADIILRYRDFATKYRRKLIVIAEDFTPNPNAVAALAHRHVLASEVLGMIDLGCYQAKLPDACRQRPAVRKSVMILNAHEEKVGTIAHKRDSYQHLRYKILEDLQRIKLASRSSSGRRRRKGTDG